MLEETLEKEVKAVAEKTSNSTVENSLTSLNSITEEEEKELNDLMNE